MTASDNRTSMPEGWTEAKLSQLLIDPKRDLVDGPFGSNLKRTDFTETGIPVFKIQNIKANRFVDGTLSYVSSKKAAELKRHSFEKGDLIITKLGNPLGLCCEVPGQYPEGIIVADLMRLRFAHGHISKRYLIYLINSPVIQDQFKTITKGTTRPRVNLTIVRELDFPIPPINEQHRIVAKIEELFSELDKSIESLKRAREQLKVYRQALLKHAFEGKLTEQWRKDKTDAAQGSASVAGGQESGATKLETADQLLARIKKTRKDRYQQQLEEWEKAVKQWEANGKEGKKPGKPRKYNASVMNDDEISDVTRKSSSWKWINFSALLYSIRGGTTTPPIDEITDYPILRSSSVRNGLIDFTDIRYLTKQGIKSDQDYVATGDLLFSRLNGTIDYVGNCAIVSQEYPDNLLYPDRLYCAKLVDISLAAYCEYFFSSPMARKHIENKAKSTAGHKRISIPDITDLPLPIASKEEMNEIVSILDTQISIIDQNYHELENNIRKGETLRQSILKKAFSGQLIAQDPNDEPASVLLERIATEKAQAATVHKKTRSAKKRATRSSSK